MLVAEWARVVPFIVARYIPTTRRLNQLPDALVDQVRPICLPFDTRRFIPGNCWRGNIWTELALLLGFPCVLSQLPHKSRSLFPGVVRPLSIPFVRHFFFLSRQAAGNRSAKYPPASHPRAPTKRGRAQHRTCLLRTRSVRSQTQSCWTFFDIIGCALFFCFSTLDTSLVHVSACRLQPLTRAQFIQFTHTQLDTLAD